MDIIKEYYSAIDVFEQYHNQKEHQIIHSIIRPFVALGLLATIGIMHFYKHAQPALLYLVPACLGTPTFVALLRGDIKSMFRDDGENARSLA